jgi:hypothetical protein
MYVSGHAKKREVSQHYDVPIHSHFNANQSSYIIGISRTQKRKQGAAVYAREILTYSDQHDVTTLRPSY